MAEPSNPNPEKLFQFTITSLTNFKPGFDALIDPDFNPTGLGIIEVSEKRVDFTAQNVDTKVAGNLQLTSIAMEDFYCNSRCQDKLMTVNFRNIFDIITDADNIKEDSITFSHFDGSDNITINLGKDPLKEYNVRLLTMVPGLFERFPSIRHICGVVSTCNELTEMVDRLESLKNTQSVSVDVEKRTVTVSIGDQPLPPRRYEDGDDGGTIGVKPGIKHHARFNWPHLDVLRKASRIEPFFTLCFLSKPENMIMILFIREDVTYLMRFISKASLMLTNQPVL